MRRRNAFLSLCLMFGLVWAALAQDQQDRGESEATAELRGADGNVVGTATLAGSEGGAVSVRIELEGFEAAAGGEHGIHIHETGSCEPDFQAAGGHFNPTDSAHGLLSPDGPHAGDLPNIRVEDDGTGNYQVTTALISLEAGETSLFDADGSAFVIHAGADDYVTDPSGASGDRIACGVIERQGQQAEGEQQAEGQQQAEGDEAAAHPDQAQLVQQGEELFAQNCRSCHGATGKGGRGIPALAGNQNLADAEAAIQQILHGGGGMPPFGRLSDEEIAALASYIRTGWDNDFGAVSVEQVSEQRQ